jgi:hypothetical protein
MEQDINPSSGQGATPQTGSLATSNPASPGATPTVKQPTTLEEALAELAELRRHATNKEEQATRHGKDLTAAQKRLADYEAKERQAQEATLSEIDKANKARTEAEAELQKYKQQAVTAHVQLVAQKTGVKNPEFVANSIERLLEYDKTTGMPTNLEEVLGNLKKSDPYLFNDTEPAPTSAQQQRPTPQFTANNPPRSAIVQPGAPQGKRPNLYDSNLWKK